MDYPKTTQISELRIYPIKSCRGITLSKSYLTRMGLKNDRRCMFIDADRKFVTIRNKPELTLIKTAIDEEDQVLKITFPAVVQGENGSKTPDYSKGTTISVPLEPEESWLNENTDLIEAEIWEFDTDAYAFTSSDISEPIKQFFTSYDPDSKVQLVMKGPTPRPARGNGAAQYLGRSEYVNFPDVLPIQVASEASLAELNSRLQKRGEKDITVERFRPNIILNSDNLIPWEEDEWKMLRFNPPSTTMGTLSTWTGIQNTAIDADVVARCARCQVPNVDPDTAIKHQKEPWSILYSYRRVDEGIKVKPCFGMLCCPRNEGAVEVGMNVQIREVMEPAGGEGHHKYIKGF